MVQLLEGKLRCLFYHPPNSKSDILVANCFKWLSTIQRALDGYNHFHDKFVFSSVDPDIRPSNLVPGPWEELKTRPRRAPPPTQTSRSPNSIAFSSGCFVL